MALNTYDSLLTPKWGVARYCLACGERHHGFDVDLQQAVAKARTKAADCFMSHMEYGEDTRMRFCMDCGEEYQVPTQVEHCVCPKGTDQWFA